MTGGRSGVGAAAGLAMALALSMAVPGCAAAGAPHADLASAPPAAGAGAAPVVIPAASPPPPAACQARVGTDRLRRSAIVSTIDEGLGRWLQTVSIDPKLEHGRFRGWIVRSLHPGETCYADVGLRENDVVTRVNGRSVEHPEEAHAVWVSLRTSPELVVDFLRDEQAHTLRFTIVDQ